MLRLTVPRHSQSRVFFFVPKMSLFFVRVWRSSWAIFGLSSRRRQRRRCDVRRRPTVRPTPSPSLTAWSGDSPPRRSAGQRPSPSKSLVCDVVCVLALRCTSSHLTIKLWLNCFVLTICRSGKTYLIQERPK